MSEEFKLDTHATAQIEANDSSQAFGKAIAAGRLSEDENSPNYAGNYMFMGYQGVTGKSLFKHIDTRQYLE